MSGNDPAGQRERRPYNGEGYEDERGEGGSRNGHEEERRRGGGGGRTVNYQEAGGGRGERKGYNEEGRRGGRGCLTANYQEGGGGRGERKGYNEEGRGSKSGGWRQKRGRKADLTKTVSEVNFRDFLVTPTFGSVFKNKLFIFTLCALSFCLFRMR